MDIGGVVLSTAAQASPGRGEIPAPSPYARQVRRAKKRALAAGYRGPHFTATECRALVEVCGGRCLACGVADDLTVDHNVQVLFALRNSVRGVRS